MSNQAQKPTICAECKHFWEEETFVTIRECRAMPFDYTPEPDYVTGKRGKTQHSFSQMDRWERNRGNCELFTPKPPSWWRRIFGGQQ